MISTPGRKLVQIGAWPAPELGCLLRAGRLLLLAPALLGLHAPSARADGTLVLKLPPSAQAIEARRAAAQLAAQQRAEQRAAQQRQASLTGNRSTVAYRGRSYQRPLGRLGVLQTSADLHNYPSPAAAVIAQAPAGLSVAVTQEVNGWTGILMDNGATAWLPSQRVRLLPDEVTEAGTAPAGLSGLGANDPYPRTNAPYFTGDPQQLINVAYRFLGVPYRWGGNTRAGIDCSGFVKRVFDALGFPLPRLGSDQMDYGIPVPPDDLCTGDRLYFERRVHRLGVKHTGIYLGNGYFIHSSVSGHGVAISLLTDPRWTRIFVCARR